MTDEPDWRDAVRKGLEVDLDETPVMPNLEELCSECLGHLRARAEGRSHFCPQCKGTGTQPTRAGMAVLQLIANHVRRNAYDDAVAADNGFPTT